MKPLLGYILALAALLVASCTVPHQSSAEDVDPTDWSAPVTLLLPNADTTTLRNIRIFLRHNLRFTDDTLTVHVHVTAPDQTYYGEQVRLVIPHSSRAAALGREAVIDYRTRVRFNRRGNYRMSITPTRKVEGVEAVGIDIVKSE